MESPHDLMPPESWPEYGYVALPKTICAREEVGLGPRGIRWSLGPITFEEYTTDETPNIEAGSSGALARNRAVAWRRVRRTDAPTGWRMLSRKPWRVDGYHELSPNYRERWSHGARHDLRRWEETFLGKSHSIEEIHFDEYEKAYAKSTVARKIGPELCRVLERKLSLPAREHLTLLGVRELVSGAIVAGTGILRSPTYKSSTRECPFILPEAKHSHAMTGLMGHWFEDALRRGDALLVFPYIKQRGDPKAWRGFSNFKSHFITGTHAYPPTLWRLARGRLY